MIQRVRTNLIETGAVVGNKLGLTSISTNNIAAGTITGNLIGLNAITGNLILDGTITSTKLQDPAGGFEDLFLMGGL